MTSTAGTRMGSGANDDIQIYGDDTRGMGWLFFAGTVLGLVAFPAITLPLAAVAAARWGHRAASAIFLCLLVVHLGACLWAFRHERIRRNQLRGRDARQPGVTGG